MAKEWYVVHTYSGFEKHVRDLLDEKIINLNLETEFEAVPLSEEEKNKINKKRDKEGKKPKTVTYALIPTEDVAELKNGEKKTVKKKTFPGYILVKMEMNDKNWHAVKSLPKVTGFIGGNQPVSIPEKDVKAMIAIAESEVPRNITKFIKGDGVEVIDGPFSGFMGIVEDVTPEKEKVRVVVSVFGRQTPIELNYLQVKRKEK